MLIPCYRDMDAYELPEEFAHLQAQDMSKIGFINDVVRGIKKIINKEELNSNSVGEKLSSQPAVSGANADALIKRGYMALEDSEWEKADRFFEESLNNDAEKAEAYFGKLLAENRCENSEALVNILANKYEKATSVESVLACQKEEEHISEISEKYYIPYYLEKEKIRKEYIYDVSFNSELKGRKDQKELQMQELESNKLLIRAKKYSTGEMEMCVEGVINKVIEALDQRIALAEEEDARNVERIKGEYLDFIKETDNEIEKLYHVAIERRESVYQAYNLKLRELENDSSAKEADFITLKNYLMNLEGYKDSISLEQRCVVGGEKARINELENQKERDEMRRRQVKAESRRKKRKDLLNTIAYCILIGIMVCIFYYIYDFMAGIV